MNFVMLCSNNIMQFDFRCIYLALLSNLMIIELCKDIIYII